MTKERIEITCPHCRRSYALRVDPDKLKGAMSMARCGRCGKRFSLAMRVSTTLEDPSTAQLEPARISFRKRITKPAMNKRHRTDPEPSIQRARDALASGVSEISVAIGPDSGAEAEVPFDHAFRQAAMQVEREALEPEVSVETVEELVEDHQTPTPPEEPARISDSPEVHISDAPVSKPPRTSVTSLSSGAPISSGAPHSSSPPVSVPPLSKQVTGAMSRQAWLEAADQDLGLLVPDRTTSVRALEWLLGEDALREG